MKNYNKEDYSSLVDALIEHSFEKLDELSKAALMTYKHKAERSVPEDEKEYEKRSKGIERATKKLAKEEVEQVDELSQDTLRKYHGAAASDLQKRREKLNKGTMTSKDHKAGQNRVKGLNRSANKMEEVELDEDTINHLAVEYINENNISLEELENMNEEELNELIGKAIGGAFKLGAKAAVGAGRMAGKAVRRLSTAGRADAAEKKADEVEKRNRDRERIRKAQERLRAARAASR